MTSSSFVSRRGKLAFDTNETIDNATETRDMKESSKGDEKGTKLTGVNRAYGERTSDLMRKGKLSSVTCTMTIFINTIFVN